MTETNLAVTEATDTPLLPLTQYAAQPDAVRTELYQLVCRTLQAVKAAIAAVTAQHEPGIREANELHATRLAAKREALGAYPDHEKVLKRLVLDYDQHEERLRIERERVAAEAARQAEETARLEEAAALEAAGETAAAEAVLEAPPIAVSVRVERVVPQVAGIQTRETWHAEVTDLRALCRAIGTREVPTEAVTPNMARLNAAARGLRENLRWPGVRAVAERGVASKR